MDSEPIEYMEDCVTWRCSRGLSWRHLDGDGKSAMSERASSLSGDTFTALVSCHAMIRSNRASLLRGLSDLSMAGGGGIIASDSGKQPSGVATEDEYELESYWKRCSFR